MKCSARRNISFFFVTCKFLLEQFLIRTWGSGDKINKKYNSAVGGAEMNWVWHGNHGNFAMWKKRCLTWSFFFVFNKEINIVTWTEKMIKKKVQLYEKICTKFVVFVVCTSIVLLDVVLFVFLIGFPILIIIFES